MTQPFEQCWYPCELLDCEVELLWLYEKHSTPPEEVESSFMVDFEVLLSVFEFRILIVMS